MGGVCARGSAMPGVCRLGVASLRRMSRWSGDARRMKIGGGLSEAYVEVEWRCEAYVGSGVPMGGVCWKWSGDGRRMLEVDSAMGGVCWKWGGDGRRMWKWVAMGGVCWKWRCDGRRMLEVEGRWEAYVGSGGAMGGVCGSGGAGVC